VFLNANLVSWSSKQLDIISRSSAKAEYHAVANGMAEAIQELHALLSKSTHIYCDNVSAVYLSTNLVQHQHTKHVEIDLHFIR
jgi:transcription termination factor Rho